MTLRVDARATVATFTLDVRFEFAKPAFLHVFGPSGSGKSTLLRVISGLKKPDRGHVALGTHVWQDESTFTPAHLRRIGYVAQDAPLFPHLSVSENLAYGFRRAPLSARTNTVKRVTEMFDLGPLLARRPTGLSGGERRRVAIARAVCMNPVLLLLDEPLSGLDGANAALVLRHLREIQRELAVPIVYVSHHVDEISRLGGDMVWLSQGRIQATGTAEALLTRLDLGATLGDEAGGVITGTIDAHETEWSLTRLSTSWGPFWVPAIDGTPGQTVSLRVRARDVSVGLTRETGSSILNTVTARVESSTPVGPSAMLVRLLCPSSPAHALLSLVTRKSCMELGLESGRDVFLRIKGVSLS